MERECCKCHCKFISTKQDAEICPDCLRNEFVAVTPSLDAEERAQLVAEYHDSMKRQAQRAEALGGAYSSGVAFSVAGKLRLALGLGIFLICGFLFLISDKESNATFLVGLDADSQRLISLILCLVSAVLVATASVRYKKTVRFMALVIAALGWFMPDILAAAQKSRTASVAQTDEKKPVTEQQKPTAPAEEEVPTGRLLSDDDLQVYYSQKLPSQRVTNYAVFIDNQDSRSRSLVREALNRLLEAEYTRAYTRANGALFVVNNVAGARRNISQLLSRFGTVTHSEPLKGIYEVRFDADRANLVSQYSADVLTSPMHHSYVTANLSELRCLDPMRVRMSARSLAGSNVRVLRNEIRDTLIDVLRDPWASEPDTYAALIDALVTYSQEHDKEAVKQVLKYFEGRRAMKREVAPNITLFLIREVPDEMVNPVLDYWCENPIAWNEMLHQLGDRVQAPLLERLASTNNLRQITSILKYLEARGTKEALPVLKRFLEYPDSIIRHSANTTYEAIRNR